MHYLAESQGLFDTQQISYLTRSRTRKPSGLGQIAICDTASLPQMAKINMNPKRRVTQRNLFTELSSLQSHF